MNTNIFHIREEFLRKAATGVAVLSMGFTNALAQDSARDRDIVLARLSADTTIVPRAVKDTRTAFVDRLSFFTPAFTKHLAEGEFNERNFGALLGVNLNKNPNSKISTTVYAGGFKNSYGNFSQMINVAFETRKGVDFMGVEDFVGAGVSVMAARYPSMEREIVAGPVPYLKFLTGNRPVSFQLGYIAVDGGKPSLKNGTFVLGVSSHLSSVFSWAKKTKRRMDSYYVSRSTAPSVPVPKGM